MSNISNIYEILEKINGCKINLNDLKKVFNEKELDIIEKLYLDESIYNTFDIDTKEETVSLTRKGKFLLFNKKNEQSISLLAVNLEENGYKACYLGDYLKTCDLDKSLEEIFKIEDYELFIHNLEQLQNARVARRIMLLNNRNI